MIDLVFVYLIRFEFFESCNFRWWIGLVYERDDWYFMVECMRDVYWYVVGVFFYCVYDVSWCVYV